MEEVAIGLVKKKPIFSYLYTIPPEPLGKGNRQPSGKLLSHQSVIGPPLKRLRILKRKRETKGKP
jgi:hypothetical protein